MNRDYRSEYSDNGRQYQEGANELFRQTKWTFWRIASVLAVGAFILGGTTWAVNIISQPGRVLSKTFDADNMINNYEYYRDAYGNFQAKVAQVHQFKNMMTDTSIDSNERSRIRIELAAIQQSCRDLAQHYNANAAKINRNIFMGTSVPSTLNAGECE